MKDNQNSKTKECCYHCGDEIATLVVFEDKSFCCDGCSSVYQIINGAGLQDFYKENGDGPVGVKVNNSYLDSLKDLTISDSLLDYKNDDFSIVSFILPTIHCASCVWLLERLHLLNTNIIDAQIVFFKKRVTIRYNHNEISLFEVAELLQKIGYPPQLFKGDKKKKDHSLIIKIGVAGFAFGNIMLLSFPEYVSEFTDYNLQKFFAYLSIALSIPVVFYCANIFYKNVYLSFKAKQISIDVPIVLGIIALLARSLYDIFILNEAGYLDSLAGLIFFLLLGKWFQGKVFDELSFERNANDYLPLAVLKQNDEDFVMTGLSEVLSGDVIKIRQNEIIPFDGIMLSENTLIDQSFMTGEEVPESITKNQKLYCGGKVVGNELLMKVTSTNRNDLFDLWQSTEKEQVVSDKLIIGFTYTVIALAIFSFIYHYNTTGFQNAFIATTSVLIVACPCALALVKPTIWGIAVRKLGKMGFYLKSSVIIEKLQNISQIVFDKTGTLTGKEHQIEWHEVNKNEANYDKKELLSYVHLIATSSIHPLSNLLAEKLKSYQNTNLSILDFTEDVGEGYTATTKLGEFKVGKAAYVGTSTSTNQKGKIEIWVSLNQEVLGFFTIALNHRDALNSLFEKIKNYELFLLSGDPNLDVNSYNNWFPEKNIHYGMSPNDKSNFVSGLKNQGKVVMLGDGINDTIAFQTADIGLAVVEQNGAFFPKCDGIIIGDALSNFGSILQNLKSISTIKIICFGFSFTYNLIGFYLAFTLKLTPLAASILMPLSSVTIVGMIALLMKINFKKA
jgi:Cu+-exporting ATPase